MARQIYAMAAMHLAMTGLTPLREPKAAARRLFMADQLMKAGATPAVIFRALDLEPPVQKAGLSINSYNPLEPRNLRGEWELDLQGQVWRPAHGP